ncbi:transcription factor PCL1-like [Impatiens glandulifera]|uniref:transcription factor PCL1-like n=1 Tax=Impatiens glandulifera TaxID=253017 RepID=UPI001FB04CB9|nr:transcription factor PCL1-like [Impatiens glandulifera]
MEYETGDHDQYRVKMEWEVGLPTTHDELIPLSQCLISSELASASGIVPEPSQDTLASLRSQSQPLSPSSNNFDFILLEDQRTSKNCVTVGGDDEDDDDDVDFPWEDDSELMKRRKMRNINDARLRLVWTSELHKRFIDVVTHLGIKEAVPKTIMKLMNVKSLTCENVSIHLLKYRLFMVKMNGLSNKMKRLSIHESSSSDHLFGLVPRESSGQEKLNVTSLQQMMSMTKLCLGHAHGNL